MTTMTFRLPTKFAQTTQALSKYRNRRTTIDGIDFSSKLEAKRYSELKLLEKAGEIDNLLLQPRYPMLVSGQRICTYVGDFQYDQGGVRVTEDAKGVLTPEFKLKAKLFRALYGRDIVLVRKK